MNRFFWTLSVGFLTLGILLGAAMTPALSLAAEEDGAAAAAADSGTKKTTKKKKKTKKSAKAAARAKADAEDAGDSDASAPKAARKTKKVKTAKAAEDEAKPADEPKADDEKPAEDAAAEDEKPAEEAVTADASPLKEAGAEAGEVRKITVKDVEFAFCWCPDGSFQMGAPEDELGYSEAEKQHEVKISKGFWMLQSEVTQEMFESLMGVNPSYFSAKGFGKEKGYVDGKDDTSKFPVDRVSYTEACDFCAKLSEICNISFQLPTEAQWEYACRAGTSYAYYTDKAPTSQQANYKSGENAPESTDEVGRHGKNPWNLYDMMGNVDEWCRDYYTPDYYASSPASDPVGPDSAENGERVLRGGSFANMEYYLRSASRNFLIEAAKGNRFDGFRFVTVPGGETSAAADSEAKADDDSGKEDEAEAKADDDSEDEAEADEAEN